MMARLFRCIVHLIFSLLVLSDFDARGKASAQIDHVQRRSAEAIAGGYSAVSNLDSDDSPVKEVAQFVVQHLSDLDQNEQSLNLDLGGANVTDGNATVVVVRGYSQVVAGTNYRLLILLLSSYIGNVEGCLGAFAVEAYVNLDGTKSISDWGQVVDCDAALGLRDDPTKEYGAFHPDFGSSGSIDDKLEGQPIEGSTSGGSRGPFRGLSWHFMAMMQILVGLGMAAVGSLSA
jgi:hypothetical protein